MGVITYSIILLSIVLVSYHIGRVVGQKQGLKNGIVYSPIKLRKELLKNRVCPICDRVFEEK
ncbi:hypothetical protein [Dethiothermospora halolimnae]|uniref:hypothetical protein n=1 Tax=Dethiothermospora halolimnae TaxID=3114390 RepID=UPI003CCC349D